MKLRNNAVSKFSRPPLRMASFGALPISPLPAKAIQDVLNIRLTVLSECGRLGLQVKFTLCPSAPPPPPNRSVPVAEITFIPRGVPLENDATPEICQCLVTAANGPDFKDGMSYCQFATKMWV